MKYIGKKSISFFMEIVLIVILVVTVLALVFLPQNVEYYLRLFYNVESAAQSAKIMLLAILYPCGIASFIVAYNLKKIFRTLVNKDPFVQENVKSLKTMGFAMITVTVFLFAKILLMNSIMTMLLAFASVLLACFCLVLADVFQQAVHYKQDNELTI